MTALNSDLLEKLKTFFVTRNELAIINRQVLSASASNVSFSSIPTNFLNLNLTIEARTDRAAELDNIFLRFNSDAGNNYDYQYTLANNTTTSPSGLRAQAQIFLGDAEAANSRASNFSPTTVEIFSYNRTDREKWLQVFSTGAFGDVSASADMFMLSMLCRWRNTAAITQIDIFPATGPNFVSGSIFTLHGSF